MSVLSSRVASPACSRVLKVSLFLACFSSRAAAHGISEASRETMVDGGVFEYVWLGAEHMVTGYDHLLFLFGVVFFLANFRDVVRFITVFTLGHCITLLGATLAGVTANAYLIDAVIAVSVIYKGFENLDGFKKTLGIQAPNLLFMVFLFGLIHGFGLSTRLQELTLGQDGLVSRILAFNVGVELGQVAALMLMLGFFRAWRSSQTFERFGRVANMALVGAGVGLFVMQVDGYLHEAEHLILPPVEGAGHHAHKGEDAHHDEPVKPTVDEDKKPVESEAAEPEADASHSHGSGKPHAHGEEAKKADASHSHGSGKPHVHGKEAKKKGHGHSHDAEPKKAAKGHSHGSGKPHSH